MEQPKKGGVPKGKVRKVMDLREPLVREAEKLMKEEPEHYRSFTQVVEISLRKYLDSRKEG